MSNHDWSDFDRRMANNRANFDQNFADSKREFDEKWKSMDSRFGGARSGWPGHNSLGGSDSDWESNSGWSTWPGHSSWPGYSGYCLDPVEYTYIIGIVIQVVFIGIYGAIYACCFKDKQSVTKMHMFVFYINTSFWGWAIYLFLYKMACGFVDGTNIWITGIVLLAIFGGSSCIEMCCSREGGYFRHQKTMNECIQYMSTMKETPPVHRVEIECYHYRTTHHTDSKGRTRTRRRKVVTYREWRDFVYDRWEDKSDYPNLPSISMETPLVAVDSTTCVAPGDDFTRMQFDNFRRNFVDQNRSRDWYIDDTVRTIVPGHEKNVTAKSEKENEVPCWLNSGLFYCLAIIFCSCPLRVLFRSRSKQHKFVITKLYFIEPHGPNMDNMGRNVTVNIVGNQGVININDNLGMNSGIQQGQVGFVQPGMQPPPEAQQYPPNGQQYPQAGQQYPPASQQYPPAAAQQYPPPGAQNYPPPQYPPPSSQPYAPMEEKPSSQGYPSANTSYPSAPAGYQAVPNPANMPPTAPSAPPPYNPNMP